MKKRRKGSPTEEKPAITINIQSWATPILGVVILIVGFFGGYYGRSLLNDTPDVIETTQPVVPPQAGAGDEDVMASLLAKVRHLKGDPNAPVTLVEFGDFQ